MTNRICCTVTCHLVWDSCILVFSIDPCLSVFAIAIAIAAISLDQHIARSH
jgi:hypothetical protein